MDNTAIARELLAHADQLDLTDPNLYRRRAFRRAAATVLAEPRPVVELLRDQGQAGLRQLIGIGSSLARAIEELICTGQIPPSRTVKQTRTGAVYKTRNISQPN